MQYIYIYIYMWIKLNMGETCVHNYTYIADYTCMCCDDVEPKHLESKNH